MEYGTALKELRKERNKTLQEIEKETGISNQNLSRWENNKILPNIDFCVKLADYYGVSLDELVGREFGHCESVHAQAVQINNGGNNTQNNFFGANNREKSNGTTNK